MGHAVAVHHAWIGVSIGLLTLASCLTQVQAVARASAIRSCVSEQESQSAVAISSSTYNLYQVIGPLIGLGLYNTVGPKLAFGLDSLTFLAAGALAAGLHLSRTVPAGEPVRRSRAWDALVQGLVYALRHRLLRALLVTTFLSWVARGVRLTLLIFLVTAWLGLPKDAVAAGALCVASAIGFIVVTPALNRVPGEQANGQVTSAQAG